MFPRKKTQDATLEEAIEAAIFELKSHTVGSAEYLAVVDQLTSLCALRKTPERVSKDTLAIIGANLAGIVLMLHYEQLHPITTKALAFLPKLK
jgi:hypothetical protein